MGQHQEVRGVDRDHAPGSEELEAALDYEAPRIVESIEVKALLVGPGGGGSPSGPL